jgi:type IX secretion system substrate protein
MKKLILLISFFLLNISLLNANIINVPNDQPTIQAGIDSASTGDTVLVQPGLYFENINFSGKNIIVGSLYLMNSDTSFIKQTIIDGYRHHNSIVRFVSGEDSSAMLIGFILQRGYGQQHPSGFFIDGGGIYCRNSGPTLKNLIIKNSRYTTDGGGIYYESSIVRLYDSNITNNHVAGYMGGVGGGIFFTNSKGIIKNVVFNNNSAAFLGGTIYSYNSKFRLQNVTCINNTGNVIDCQDSTHIEIINSIFWNVPSPIIDFWTGSPSNSVTVLYSDLQGGVNSISTNNIGTVHWLDGNIDLDPQFADTIISNYNLSATSPCIDAGIHDTLIVYNNDLDTIIISELNFLGTAPDMGACEFDPATLIRKDPLLLENFILYQNYPNPFNSITTIEYYLPHANNVLIEIYNLLGQKVKTIMNDYMIAGYHEFKINAKDLPSGVYIYKIKAGNFHQTKKMLLLK